MRRRVSRRRSSARFGAGLFLGFVLALFFGKAFLFLVALNFFRSRSAFSSAAFSLASAFRLSFPAPGAAVCSFSLFLLGSCSLGPLGAFRALSRGVSSLGPGAFFHAPAQCRLPADRAERFGAAAPRPWVVSARGAAGVWEAWVVVVVAVVWGLLGAGRGLLRHGGPQLGHHGGLVAVALPGHAPGQRAHQHQVRQHGQRNGAPPAGGAGRDELVAVVVGVHAVA